ncbi:MAG: hypothetical protein KKG59_00750, partial [Nanoarchaeota archaeon]|nr:hypothetical protein [Nanoarchaeota archaeon]
RSQKQLEELRPYVEGICASVETTAMPLHDEVCPDKPLEPYEHLLQSLKGFKRSCCIIIGIGEQKKDLDSLLDFIDRNKLDRITFYALKPVKGSPYKESPDPDYYAWWIEETRKRFPKLEIMAGLTPKKVDYAEKVIRAGANGLTKFPAIRKFNSKEAADVERGVKNAGKKLDSSLTKLPKLDWMAEIDKLDLDNNIKQEMKKTVPMYLKKMEKK